MRFMDDRVAISLLRHGMTKENENSAYIGSTDSVLSQKGKENVYAASTHIAGADLVFSSSLSRCQKTADILFPKQKIVVVEELKEMHFGSWEGKTYDDLKTLSSYKKWLDDPFSEQPDSGESFATFGLRVLSGWSKVKEKIIAGNASSSAIVTHGGVIRYLLSTFSSCKKSFFEWNIPYVGGYQLIWSKTGFRRGEKCMSLQEVPLTERQRG